MRISRAAAKPLVPPSQAGFTLVEMLVAMLLLGLVGLTLARFQTLQLGGAASLTATTIARLEADNLAISALVSPGVPSGVEQGTSTNFGRQWHWQQTAGPSPDPALLPDLVTIEISVSANDGGPVLARRTIVRPQGSGFGR